MGQKYSAKNARQFKRLKAFYLVKYQVSGKGDAPRLTNVRDISAGGVKFLTEESLPEDASIKLSILVPTLQRTLEAKAKILRVSRGKEGITYSVAVKFTDISGEDKLALNQFVEDIARDKDARVSIDHADVVVRQGKS